jgi:molybdopterin biosynthesis enzyme
MAARRAGAAPRFDAAGRIEAVLTGSAAPGREPRAAGPLTSVADALAALLADLPPVGPRTVAHRAAEGKVLAAPLRAPGPVPERSIALRDGFAVLAEDLVGASSFAPAMRAEPPPWVSLGDALPAGCDAVLPPDVVSEGGGFAEITASIAPGEGVRRKGEDAAPGAMLREAGRVLRASDAAVAQAAGVKTCAVREPRVGLLLGGAPDASTDVLLRFVASAGAQVTHQTVGERTRASAIVSTPPADLLLMAGDRALALDILARHGAVAAQALALRPGEAAACGRIGRTPVVIVPPRLEAALALALVLVRPCLDRLAGVAATAPAPTRALVRKISSRLGVTELVLLRETPGGLEPLAVGDVTLAAIGAAERWCAVPPQSEGYAAGELIETLPLWQNPSA